MVSAPKLLRKVRGIGSGVTHLADLAGVTVHEFRQFNANFAGVFSSDFTALCGVRPAGRISVIMQPETKRICRTCKHVEELLSDGD